MSLGGQYDAVFADAGAEWNVDPQLLKAMAGQESGGDPRAVSPAGARGLMQIMPATGRGLGMTDLHDPVQSIFAAAKYMNEALDAERTPEDALRYYHGGPGWRSAYGPESRRYAPAVTARYVALGQAQPPRGVAARTGGTDVAGPGVPPASATPEAQPQDAPEQPAPAKGASVPTPAADPFSAALDAAKSADSAKSPPTEPDRTRQNPTEPAAADPFTAALDAAKGAPPPAPAATTFGPEPPANEKAGNAMIPGPPSSAPTVPNAQDTYQPGVGARVGNFLGDAATRLGQAVGAGYQNTPGVLTPAAQAAVESVPVVGEPLGLLAQGASVALKLGAGLFSGTQSGVATAGDVVSPGLGRELAGGMEILPAHTGMHPLSPGAGVAALRERVAARIAENAEGNARFSESHGGAPPPAPPPAPAAAAPANPLAQYGPPPPPASPAFVPPGSPGSTLPRILDLIRQDDATAANKPTMIPPRTTTDPVTGETSPIQQPPSGPNAPPAPAPGAPGSVGAAASRDMSHPDVAVLAPEDMKANRRQAEMQTIHDPIEPGDVQIYVKGSTPTKAEYSGNPLVSQQETVLRQHNPEEFNRRLAENNAARVADFEDFTPSHTEVRSLERDRSAQAARDDADLKAHWQPADGTPALDAIDGVLNDVRNSNRDSVRKNLAPYRERLFDADGRLKTDAEAWRGIRDDLTEKLDHIGSDPQSTMGYVKKEVLALRNAVDAVLNKASDGKYQTFLDNYAGYSQKINEGKLLGEFRDKSLTNAKGEIQGNRFHKFVTDLAHERGEKGLHPEMDITDATMARLLAIDKDLKRSGQIDLGKARGSGTHLFGTIAKGMGLAGAHAVTALTAPGIGNIILQGAVNHGVPIVGKMRLDQLTRRHLREPPGGFHPLVDPNAPP